MTKKSIKCYVDANVLLYYKITGFTQHVTAVSLLETLIQEKTFLCISPLTLDEFLHGLLKILRVNKHIIDYVRIRNAIDELFTLPHLHSLITPSDYASQLKVVSYMEQYNLRPRDAYHLLTMKANGIDSFATFDRDFERVFKKGEIEEFK